MSYTKTTWVDDGVPAINAVNLNKMETGISDGIVKVLKAKGTATGSMDDTEIDLTWGNPTINTSDISVSSADITINTDGIYIFDVSLQTTNANRTELFIRTYVDTGGGYVQDTDEIVSDYVSRDTDQNTGGVTLSTALDLNDGDIIKFAGFGDTDGTCVANTAGTILRIQQIL